MIRKQTSSILGAVVVGVAAFIALACTQSSEPKREAPVPTAAHGRYLIVAGGCNDCHTPGYAQIGMAVPESLWLTGVPVGWRGPWGTTYGSNLRLFVKDMDDKTFIAVLRARDQRPPMPWSALHAMTDDDLRSMYLYLKQLGPSGQQTPADLLPGQEPSTPWIDTTVHVPGWTNSATTKPSR
jgi:mono/diheme cytochrome c family protein